jgi:RNA polymerase sigma-70 factor (ECF subfamily)
MSQKVISVVGQVFRMLAADVAGVSDGELLSRYLAKRDENAFAAIVRRHGPMVLGVCHRILRNGSDIDDAFQATFLVLVRKADTIRPRGMVGNWLYGVAYQTAVRARSLLAKRRSREVQMAKMPETAAPDTAELWADLQPLLDRELHALPDKYRMPIVLCDLEGMSRREAAAQLNWPEGTVAGRLTRGRKLLAGRLSSRGVSLSVGSLVAALADQAALAQLPSPVVESTVKATMLFAAGSSPGVISQFTAELTQGVLTAMLISKLKMAMAVALMLGFLGVGAGMLRQSPAPDSRIRPQPSERRPLS